MRLPIACLAARLTCASWRFLESKTNVKIPSSLSNRDLGKLFDFGGGNSNTLTIKFSDYARKYISNFHHGDGKYGTSLFTDPFKLQALREILNGNTVDFKNKIYDRLTNKCAKTIFYGLENGIYEDHPIKPEVQIVTENLNKLNFSESILKLFADSYNTHLIIRNAKINGANARTRGATITIGNDYLKKATQLFIARTMIHESVHAYINALYSNIIEFNSFSFVKKIELYAKDNGYTIGTNNFHHNFMGQYVNAIAYSLYEWDKDYGTGGELGWSYYKAMAFGGLFQTDNSGTIISETDTFKKIIPSKTERQKIADIVFNEFKGNKKSKGSSCE